MNVSTADTTFDAFVGRLTSGLAQRIQVGTGRLEMGRYRGQPDDGPKSAPPQHILVMGNQYPTRFERRAAGSANGVYTRQPGALCLVPAGVAPVLYARTQFEFIVCALDSNLVNDVESEMEGRPDGELRPLINTPDAATQQLMTLLLAEAKESFGERLYTDHLAHALAARLLFLTKMPRPETGTKTIPALPRHILRRVIDRMRDLTSDLGLQALAAESGYSRVHFARMFRAATGQTPHRYLLHLRVERAQELMRNPSLSLTDIALDCGFSSHSHLTRSFHELLGATPSEFRRSLT